MNDKILWGQIAAVGAIVILAVWAATQWTAAALGYQPALGAPWFRIGDYPEAELIALRMAEAEREVRRFRQEGLDPSAMLGAALRHALALLNARLDDPSASASSLVANWRGLHFKRKGLVETQLSRWSPGALRHAAAALQEAVLACRRSDAGLAHAHASAALLRIAGEAARRRG